MNDNPLAVENIHQVNSMKYFPESETYDGLSQNLRTHFAEGSLVSEDNPLHIGGVELIRSDHGVYGYSGFSVNKNSLETDWFQHRYSSDEYSDLEDLALYFARKIVDERNTGKKEDSWWATVKEHSSWYTVRLYWSADTDTPPRKF